MATLLALRHAGDPLPAAAVLLSPFLDVTGSGESVTTRADIDPWFNPEDLPVVARYYCPDEKEWRNPLVSPVFANVAGLPPMLIQVGVELEVWPDMWHVFQFFVGKMPESRQAIVKIAEFIRRRI
jgi:acetyl esterase/lipase